MSKYIKHVYWMTEEQQASLCRKLGEKGMKVKSAKGVVCTPLDRINKISVVAPAVWSETCARQGSWYRSSNKKGLYLVVSSFEVQGQQEFKAATITESDFRPPRRATPEEKTDLVAEPGFQAEIPEDWRHVRDLEKRIYLRWARRLGSDVEHYAFLYLSHTANHANFIRPRFYVQDSNGLVPYSIDRSAHLCSCCVELFQVLGSRFQRKLVAPCPGATIFARLKPDRFLQVERP